MTPSHPLTVANSRLRLGGLTITQCDATTCGATCVLAARLLLQEAAPGRLLRAAAASAAPGRTGRALADRVAALQRSLQTAMNRRGLGPLPWPRALGSTPWSVARAMGWIGRYGVAMVRDQGAPWGSAVEECRAHLARGHPVLLLTGGPLIPPGGARGAFGRRLREMAARAPAVPRHYVLTVPWTLLGRTDPGAGRVYIYEPSSGSVRPLDLLAARGNHGAGPRELGYWPRVLALIAPTGRS